METIDEEFLKSTIDFIDRAHRDKKPFFVWLNPTRMHIWTRLKPEAQGKTGLGIYPDGMAEHDEHVGQLLRKLDDLGITWCHCACPCCSICGLTPLSGRNTRPETTSNGLSNTPLCYFRHRQSWRNTWRATKRSHRGSGRDRFPSSK
jgi:hypothetical protein